METGSHWQAEEADWACIDTTAGDDDDEYPHAVIVSRIKDGTRKRLYEHGEDELEDDREMDKLYKRDYWDDPAYAPLLELSSLGTARAEAVICFSERARRASEAMVAEWRREWEERRCSRAAAADEQEPEPEPEAAPAAAASEGRLFLCFWRSIVDNLAALLHYFLG